MKELLERYQAAMADVAARKEEYLRAWFAETGLQPTECELVLESIPSEGKFVTRLYVRRRLPSIRAADAARHVCGVCGASPEAMAAFDGDIRICGPCLKKALDLLGPFCPHCGGPSHPYRMSPMRCQCTEE